MSTGRRYGNTSPICGVASQFMTSRKRSQQHKQHAPNRAQPGSSPPQDQKDSYPWALNMTSRLAPQIASHLNNTETNRTWRTYQLLAEGIIPASEQAFTYLAAAQTATQTSGTLNDTSQLIQRAQNDITTGIELLISGQPWALGCVTRDLMELEALLYDFAYDPHLITQWVTATNREHQKQFSPGAVRTRIANHRHPGKDLPDTLEYQIHSELIHITKTGCDHTARTGTYEGRAEQAQLRIESSDLISHISRVVGATMTLLNTDNELDCDINQFDLDMLVDVNDSLNAWLKNMFPNINMRPHIPVPKKFRLDDFTKELRSLKHTPGE